MIHVIDALFIANGDVCVENDTKRYDCDKTMTTERGQEGEKNDICVKWWHIKWLHFVSKENVGMRKKMRSDQFSSVRKKLIAS